jgi:hypothetical protein
MSDERLNTAIDEVARQMTDPEPGAAADLRRQVVARIEAGGTPRERWRIAFVWSPLAVATVFAVVFFVARSFQPADVRRPGTLGTPVKSLPSSPIAAAAQPEQTSTRRPTPEATVPAARRNAEHPAGSFEPAVAGTMLHEPAPPIEPLDVAPLTVDALRPDPIPVEQLETIAPILVAPLDITDTTRRNP